MIENFEFNLIKFGILKKLLEKNLIGLNFYNKEIEFKLIINKFKK